VSFPTLLEAALAGALRQDPPPLLAAHAGLAAEDRLLHGASFEGLRRLAGRPLERIELPAAEPAPPEPRAEVPGPAAARLVQLLEERHDLLPEWLELAAARNLRVPHIVLADVLEYARTADQRERDLILAVGGTRLSWLARQHPDWQFAAYADPEEQFARGARDERASALRRIRQQDPARGRELLQEAWPAERGEQRAHVLGALATGLSIDDEPLLERAIGDARNEVRVAALRLIRRIPESRFKERWAGRARQAITFKGTRVSIHEPIAADGLETQPPKGMGTTGWLVQHLGALAPPSIWPSSALEAFQRNDFAKPLVAGLGQAAVAYADTFWCTELLMLQARQRQDPLPLDAPALYEALDASGAEAVLRRLLELPPGATAGLFNGRRTEQWSAAFSSFLVPRLLALVGRWQYATLALLAEAPRRLDPRVLPAAEALLDQAIESDWARPAMERIVHTLEIRAAMRQELG
jgi:hypothetical protein